MWKQKIGISVGNNYPIPTTDVIKLVSSIGFDAVSPEWQAGVDVAAIVSAARACGLSVQSLHAPFGRSAGLWSKDDSVSTPAKNEIFAALDACIQLDIPVLVAHIWIGFDYKFDAAQLHYDNFDQIVAHAQKHNVKIAFENTEGTEYLFALMEHFKDNDTVGFCWDSGHEMCYNHSLDLLASFGDRLIMTHLNDNLGISRFDGTLFWTDDLHLLPYDGIADWEYNVERLKKARHMDILNFELTIYSKPGRHENDIYWQMSLQQYFTEAYKRACKIAYRYSK